MVEDLLMPPVMASAVIGRSNSVGDRAQLAVPFGDGVLQCLDTTLAGACVPGLSIRGVCVGLARTVYVYTPHMTGYLMKSLPRTP